MKTYFRLFASLAFAACAALLFSGCTTSPPAAAAPPVASKTTLDLMLEVRSKELDLERTNTMAWLKFASDSNSDLVKGFVMGKSAGGGQAGGAGATQSILQAQAQADATALRREELAAQNSTWNKGLQLFDRGAQLFMFSTGLSFQRYTLDASNSQQRYTLDALRGTQQDGYSFNSRLPYFFSLPAGSEAVKSVPAE